MDDCGDDSDEQNCGCADGEFSCSNGGCIYENWVCDDDNDCGDNSDEQNCEGGDTGGCADGEFSCSNGGCIYENWVCDNDNDCGDNSDEQNCEGGDTGGSEAGGDNGNDDDENGIGGGESSGSVQCGIAPKYTTSNSQYVVGGTEADESRYPWQVLLSTCYGSSCYQCGGSILNKDWVITAAHC